MSFLTTLGTALGGANQGYQQQQEAETRRQLQALQMAEYRQRQQREQQQQQALAAQFGALSSPNDLSGLANVGGGGGIRPVQPQQASYAPQPSGGPSSPVGGGMSAPAPDGGGGVSTLRSLLQQASAALPDGYRAVVTSAERPGATVAGTGGTSQHAHGNAIDVQIIGPNGPIPNKGEDTTGLYQKLAVAMRGAASPEMAPKLAWGGNFTTGPENGPRDLMHFDLGGDRGRFGSLTKEASAAGQMEVPPQLRQQAQQTAQATQQSIDPFVYGKMSLQGLARQVEKNNPSADPVVKMMAVEGLAKLLAPGEQQRWQLFMEDKREAFQRQMEMTREKQQNVRDERRDTRMFKMQTRREDEKAKRDDAKGTLTEITKADGTKVPGRVVGGKFVPLELPEGATGVSKMGTASQSALDPKAQSLISEGIANYQLPPLSGWALKSPQGQTTMAQVMKANPDYDATKYTGKQSGARAMGTRSANLEMATDVAEEQIPLVQATSEKIDRTEFPTLNALVIAAEKGTGDENVVRFLEQINTLKYLYGRALNPTGVARIEDLKRFDEIINAAWSKGQIRAALDQMKISLAAERRGVDRARSGGKEPATAKPAAAGALPDDLPDPSGVAEGSIAKDEQGNPVAVLRGGKWASP